METRAPLRGRRVDPFLNLGDGKSEMQEDKIQASPRSSSDVGNRSAPRGGSEVLQADEGIKGLLLWTVQSLSCCFNAACPVYFCSPLHLWRKCRRWDNIKALGGPQATLKWQDETRWRSCRPSQICEETERKRGDGLGFIVSGLFVSLHPGKGTECTF